MDADEMTEDQVKCRGSDGDGCDSAPMDIDDAAEIRTVTAYERGTAQAAGDTSGLEVRRYLCPGCLDALLEDLQEHPANRKWYMDADGAPLVEDDLHYTKTPGAGDWAKVACGLTHIAAGHFTSGKDAVTCPACKKHLGLDEEES